VVGRVGKRGRLWERGPNEVVSKRRGCRHRTRCGGDAGGVDILKPLCIPEDAGELSGKERLLFIGELEMRERRDALDVVSSQGQSHAEC